MEKLNMHTQDAADANIGRIGQLFPNCLTERLDANGKPEMAIDFDKFRQELSKEIVEGTQERYQFTWPGKREAMRLANMRMTSPKQPVNSVTRAGCSIQTEIWCLTDTCFRFRLNHGIEPLDKLSVTYNDNTRQTNA